MACTGAKACAAEERGQWTWPEERTEENEERDGGDGSFIEGTRVLCSIVGRARVMSAERHADRAHHRGQSP